MSPIFPFHISQKIMILGGKSRSGKSTLAELWRGELQMAGFSPIVLHLDNYLGGPGYLYATSQADGSLPIAEELRLKYDYDRIYADICSLLHGDIIQPPVYERKSRIRLEDHASHSLQLQDYLIIEGTPALSIEQLSTFDACRVYLQADEEEREKQLMRDWIDDKGLSPARAHQLLSYRRQWEEPFIALGAQSADISIRRSAGRYFTEDINL